MIEFYLIGTFFSYRQYKKYIDYTFEYSSGLIKTQNCQNVNLPKSDVFNFNRNELILVFLYNILYTLFVLSAFIYAVYMYEIGMQYVNKSESNDLVLLKQMASNNMKYNLFMNTPNLFMETILKVVAISFVLNIIFVQILILYRGKIEESNKTIIKQDLNIIMVISIIFFGFTFLFV
mgnify:CR=1 FL=1|jgi:hypothetical protein